MRSWLKAIGIVLGIFAVIAAIVAFVLGLVYVLALFMDPELGFAIVVLTIVFVAAVCAIHKQNENDY
jgi:hypothetical protein